jgi:hypothetical protein
MKAITSFLLALVCACPLLAQGTGNSLFDFKADIRLFTAYAFMNAAGNDGEWRKAGMHPIRVAVRRDLEGRLDSASVQHIRAFHLSRNRGSWTGYAPYALITAGPPDFRVSYDPSTSQVGAETEQEYAGLSELLAEFYQKANIPQLWQKYGPLIQTENDRRRPFAGNALADITSYCRLDSGYFSRRAAKVHFEFAPLLSYFTGQTVKVDGDIYIIAGPQEGEPGESDFYHEALHHVISPLSASLDSGTIRGFDSLFALGSSAGHIGYDQLEESFVRVLDRVVAGRRYSRSDSAVTASITQEYRLGFVLCLAIFEQLRHYETSQMTFAEYFPTIIKNIDVERERQRWVQFKDKPK